MSRRVGSSLPIFTFPGPRAALLGRIRAYSRPLLLAAIAGLIAMPTADRRAVLAQQPDDPSTVLADRSPGARSPGALYQSKPAYPTAALVPSLASTLAGDQPPDYAPPATLPTALPATVLDTFPIAPTQFAALPFPPDLIAPGGGLPPGIWFIPPPVGFISGGGGGGGIAPSNPEAPPVASVPEPATWAAMLVGFLAIGGALRRRPALTPTRPRS